MGMADTQIPLTPRLRAVADYVPDGARLADIGTDHAYVPIAVAGRIAHAVASDVRPGPLARASENIARYGLAGRIETRLAGGLSGLVPGEVDTIVIAGMGGVLITEILEAGRAVAQAAERLVLQPMTAIAETRRYLCTHGFQIVSERLAAEGDKLYTILLCMSGKMTVTREGYYHIGEALFRAHDPLLPRLLEKQIGKYTKMVDGLRRSVSGGGPRLAEAERLLAEFVRMRAEL